MDGETARRALEKAEKALIVRLSALGDVLHVLPALSALCQAFPHLSFSWVTEELSAPDVARHIDEAELDTIKVLLSYILIKESELDLEEIYTFVFGKGKQLVWH